MYMQKSYGEKLHLAVTMDIVNTILDEKLITEVIDTIALW